MSVRTAGLNLARRLEELRSQPPYANYERVREEVLRMKDAEQSDSALPSAYWREELLNFEYMLDASPLIIEKLKQHAFHITGVRAYEYRTHAQKLRDGIADKLSGLKELDGGSLLVAEPRELGGFGFEIDGGLFNVDTLKFYEVLIALERGEVLGQFRDGRRRVVMEIGSGWGGFAYHFHTLFPNTSYVLVDLPELFLFSAVYLTSLFPEAKVGFWDDAQPFEPQEIADYDFVFVPHTAFPSVRVDEVSLGVNMVSFQEMTTAQVEGYVHGMYELGCTFLYSLNRDKSRFNPELTGVHEIMATRYWMNEISVLPVPYTVLTTKEEQRDRQRREKARRPASKKSKPASKKSEAAGHTSQSSMPAQAYRHMIGWRRVDVD